MKTVLLAMFSLATIGATAQTKTIVFVCEHGSAKSVIAAAYFNKLAKEKGIPWQAVARGTDPDKLISPKTEKLLKDDGLFDKTLVPQKISQADIDGAQQVCLFFPLPGTFTSQGKTTDWQNVKAVNEDFPRLRDDILRKLEPLIDSLKIK